MRGFGVRVQDSARASRRKLRTIFGQYFRREQVELSRARRECRVRLCARGSRQARCASRHGDNSVKLVVSILCRLDNIVAETFRAKRNASVGIDTRRDLAWGGFHRHGDERRGTGDRVRDATGSLAPLREMPRDTLTVSCKGWRW